MKQLVLIWFVLFLIPFQVAQAELYRWVDDDGRVHYSDSVPPEKSRNGHTEMDKQGNRLEEVAAEKSGEQLKEEEWLTGLEARLKRKKEQQQREDELLLETYTDIQQFDRLYEERLTKLEDERKQLVLLSGELDKELERLLAQHEQASRSADKKRIKSFIKTSQENVQAYEEAIEWNQREEKTLRREMKEMRKRLLSLLNKKQAKADGE